MRVSLLNVTPHALETLIFTKNTRLKMAPNGLQEIIAWPQEKKDAEWQYMQGTIQSGWEFVDYIFLIEDVTRAFTHQLVRHRVGTSFAQQAQRAVDMSGFEYVRTGALRRAEDDDPLPLYGSVLDDTYDDVMRQINQGYLQLVEKGVPPQDARGILPTNICTNIVFKANLRTLHEMALKRLCVKAQGEFQNVFRAIRDVVVKIHPWAEPVLRVQCAFNGVCAFPTFPVKDCPVKKVVYDPTTGRAYGGSIYPGTLGEIQELWEMERAEAQPGLPSEKVQP